MPPASHPEENSHFLRESEKCPSLFQFKKTENNYFRLRSATQRRNQG